MTEENHSNEDTQAPSGPDRELTDKVAQIEALEGNLRKLRWGLFLGVLAILLIGMNAIYNTSRNAVQPVTDMYGEAKTSYEEAKPRIDAAQSEFTRLQPKVESAYTVLSELLDKEGDALKVLRSELQQNLDDQIKPAAEELARAVMVDLQDDAMKKLAEISANSDELLSSAQLEYQQLTNGLPKQVTKAIEETLVQMIRSRDDRIREMFPKLTKEKQAAVVSRFSELSEEQGQELFGTLFAEHLTELGDLQRAMNNIYDKEAGTGSLDGKSNVESTIALIAAILDIAMDEYAPGAVQPEEQTSATQPAPVEPPTSAAPTPEPPTPAPSQPAATDNR